MCVCATESEREYLFLQSCDFRNGIYLINISVNRTQAKGRLILCARQTGKEVDFLLQLNPTTALTHLKILIYIYDSTGAGAGAAALVAVNAIGTDTVTAQRSAKK